IDERVAYYVKARATELAGAMASTDWNAAFDCTVEQVLADEVNEELEPGAYVASGVTYVNPQRDKELERARAVLAELRAAPAAMPARNASTSVAGEASASGGGAPRESK